MGLGGIAFLKNMLRKEARFATAMKHASYSSDRRHERPKDKKTVGKGIETGFDVVIVELMLRKYALLKRCRSVGDFAVAWRDLAREQLDRFPHAKTMVFLFDDETDVPMAKGETQRGRRKSGGFTAEEQVILGPYRYLCNNNPSEFNRRVNGLFEGEAAKRSYNNRTAVTAFELFMTKHMHTPGLREDEFEFATRCIASAEYAQFARPDRPKRIIVDRGVWRSSYERGPPSEDPYEGGAEPWVEAVAPSFPSVRRIPPPSRDVYHKAYSDIADELGEYLHSEGGEEGRSSARTISYLERLSYIAVDAFRKHKIRFEDLPDLLGHHQPPESSATAMIQSALDLYNKIGSDALYGIDRMEDVGDYYYEGNDDDDDADTDAEDGGSEICGEVGTAAKVVDTSAARAWILIDANGVRSLGDMDGEYVIGEADLKIPHYARLFAGSSVFVVCHDTDLLPILLMTVKDWVPQMGRCRGQLVLDMTTPSDVKKRPPLPGVVDIIELWRVIHEWFDIYYQEIRNPVEVFCLLIILMGTDYVHNPPMLGPGTLWKAFSDKKLYVHLANAIATDGHMGSAIPPQDQEVIDGGEELGEKDVVRLLKRDLGAGAFFALDQEKVGRKHCPRGRRTPGIEVYESAITKFLLEAYSVLKGKFADKWPPREWFYAQSRRVAWQMAYWYQGDTLEGRILDDEMAQDPPLSVYGWHWVPDPESRAKENTENGEGADAIESAKAVFGSPRTRKWDRKRKAGCLGRTKPSGFFSEPAPAVVSVERFRELRRKRRRLYTASLSSLASQKEVGEDAQLSRMRNANIETNGDTEKQL